MPTITLKDIPSQLHRALKVRAKRNRRSLNKETIAMLAAVAAAGGPALLEASTRRARNARASFKRVIRASEITAWKNVGR